MSFTQLLNRSMKDDAVIELLERYDISVIYDFDRMHENADDVYWAAAMDVGFQLRFNKHQILDVIFLYLSYREGFFPIDPALVDVPIFATFDDAQNLCFANGLPYKASAGEPGSKNYKRWIKFDVGRYTAHYQYHEGQICLITLEAKAVA